MRCEFLVIIFSILFSSCSIHSVEKRQNYTTYYLTVNKADSLFLVENYQESYKLLDKLFKDYKPTNCYKKSVELYLKSAYLSSNQVKRKYYESLLKDYGMKRESIDSDSVLKKGFDKYHFLHKEIKSLSSVYYENQDSVLLDTIGKMIWRDQFYRIRNKDNEHIHQLDMRKSMIQSDSLNNLRLLEILAVDYPNCKVDINVSRDINTILMHTRDSIRVNYYLPKILEYIKNGKANPIIYANMYDQYLSYESLPQIYGTVLSANRKTRKVKLPSLMYSMDSTNYFRNQIGLPTWEYEKWYFEEKYGIAWENMLNE